MITLTQDEQTRLLSIYSVMDPIIDRFRLANYRMIIQASESTKVFHDTVESLHGTNIDIAEFIGFHAIGACMDGSTKILLKEVMPLLKESARDKLDSEAFNKMSAWLEGMNMNAATLANSSAWSKLGGFCKHSYYLAVFSEDTADFIGYSEEKTNFIEVVKKQSDLVEACKGVNDNLDQLASELIRNMRNALQAATAQKTMPPTPAP